MNEYENAKEIIKKCEIKIKPNERKYSRTLLKNIQIESVNSKFITKRSETINKSFEINQENLLSLQSESTKTRKLNKSVLEKIKQNQQNYFDEKFTNVKGFKYNPKTIYNSQITIKPKNLQTIKRNLRLRSLIKSVDFNNEIKNTEKQKENNYLSYRELKALESACGLSSEQILLLYEDFHDPGINFEEFMKISKKLNPSKKSEKLIYKKIFEEFDNFSSKYLNWINFLNAISISLKENDEIEYLLFFHVFSEISHMKNRLWQKEI